MWYNFKKNPCRNACTLFYCVFVLERVPTYWLVLKWKNPSGLGKVSRFNMHCDRFLSQNCRDVTTRQWREFPTASSGNRSLKATRKNSLLLSVVSRCGVRPGASMYLSARIAFEANECKACISAGLIISQCRWILMEAATFLLNISSYSSSS